MVTCARTPSASELIHRLRVAGYFVLACDSMGSPMGKFLASEYRRYDSPVSHFVSFKSQILGMIEKFDIDLLIPNSEEIFFLAKIEGEVREKCKFFCPSFSLIHQLHHKRNSHQLLSQFQIYLPRNYSIHDQGGAPDNLIFQSDSWVIKKDYSRFGEETFLEWNQDVLNTLKTNTESNEYFFQERLSGKEVSAFAWFQDGELMTHSVYSSQMRYSKASIHFKKEEDSRIEELFNQIGKQYQLNGQISFDFMLTDQGVALIECNPRCTSGIHLIHQLPFEKLPHKREGDYVLSSAVLLQLISYPNLIFQKSTWKMLRCSTSVFWRLIGWKSWFVGFPAILGFVIESIQSKKPLHRVMTQDLVYNGETDDEA